MKRQQQGHDSDEELDHKHGPARPQADAMSDDGAPPARCVACTAPGAHARAERGAALSGDEIDETNPWEAEAPDSGRPQPAARVALGVVPPVRLPSGRSLVCALAQVRECGLQSVSVLVRDATAARRAELSKCVRSACRGVGQ